MAFTASLRRSHHSKFLLSASLAALTVGWSGTAHAQQTTPGVSPNCPIVTGEAICEGDLEDGISSTPATPAFDTLIVRNPNGPIAPPGYFAIGVVKNDSDITINIADDVVINVFDDPNIAGVAQGLIAIVDQGFDLIIDTSATITADGNGSFGLGIEALVSNGDGNLFLTNDGDISTFTSFESAIAIQGRQQNSTGILSITNNGDLSATSGGTGERSLVTAGILARHDNGGSDIAVTNGGTITVSATTVDTDFNGVAAGIVSNSFVGANTTGILNAGAITSTGQAVHGIVGFTSNDSATETARLSIANQTGGTLSIDGADNYGILAQSAGTSVDTTVDNSAEITMANGANSNGIFVLSRATESRLSLNNRADVSGAGTLLRGLGVSTFGAPAGGTYDMLIFNEGDIALDAPAALGMTVFATREDTVEADVVNTGDLDLSNTTSPGSIGISVNLNAVDASAGGAVGSSSARIVNRGDIAMGAGRGIFVVADDIAVTNFGSITTTGAMSDGIVADASTAVGWQVTVAETGSVVTSGAGSVGIRISGVSEDYVEAQIQEATAATTVQKARMADQAMNAITQFITSSAPGNGGIASASGVQRPLNVPGTGVFVPAATGNVVVNGTVRSDGGAGAILGDSALSVAVRNADAVIATTGNDAPAISATTSIQLIGLEGLTLTTTGDNASLVQLNGGGLGTPGDSAAFVALNDLTASTMGDGSTAFVLDSGGGQSVANFASNNFADPGAGATISTMGDNAHGVQFVTPDGGSTFAGEVEFTQLSTAGDGSLGFNIDAGGNSSANLALLDSTVTTGGANSDAIRLGIGGGSDVLLLVQRSTVSTTGDGSDAIDIPQIANSSIGNGVIIGSDISTESDNARAFVHGELGGDTSSRTAFIADSTFTTQGDGSTALLFGAYGNTSSSTTSIFDTVITTAGSNARGIDHGLGGDGSANEITIENSSVTTTGATNSGAMIFEGTVDNGSAFSISLSDIDLSTVGSDSDGVFIGGGGFDSSVFSTDSANLTIATQGDNSRGFVVDQFIAGDGSTSVGAMDNISITTEGMNAHGMLLGTSRDGAMVNSSTAFQGTSLDITTQGDGARGFYLAGLTGDMVDSDYTVSITESTIATAGDDAIGFEIAGVGGAFTGSELTMALDGIDIATSGSGSHAMVIGNLPMFAAAANSNSVLAIDIADVTTTGAAAHGIVIGSGWGTPGAAQTDAGNNIPSRFNRIQVSGDVSASGAGSHGIVTDSLLNSFTVAADGSITADGFALLSQGNGGVAQFTNRGTITGDIRLGAENSSLVSSGTITGNIDMGGGTNAITIEGGGLLNSQDQILLGDGNAITVAGTLAPGGDGPIQLTNIGSELVFEAGSQFLVDIDGMATDPVATGFFASDRLLVDGGATINGGDVVVSTLTPQGDFDRTATFLLIDASGGVTGEFTGIVADLPFLDLNLSYEANRVILNATRAGPVVPFASLGTTPNQVAVGAAFDTLEPDATGDLDTVIDQLIFATTTQALTAFDTASGEIYASLLAQAVGDALRHGQHGLARARMARGSGWGIWGGASFSDSSIDADGNAAEVQQDDVGFDLGIDYVGAENGWALGMAGGMRDGSLEVAGRASAADYDSWYLSVYGRYGSGGAGFTVSGALTWSQTDAAVERAITVNTLQRTALGDAEIDALTASAEVRYGWGTGGGWAFGPLASLHHGDADLSLVDETGAGSLSLRAADASDQQTTFGGGLFANWQGSRGSFDLSAQYVDAANNTVGTRLAFGDGANAPFTVLAPETDGAGLLGAMSGNLDLGSGWTLSAETRALFRTDRDDISGSISIGWRF
ncbi:autotransporter domain-containing protein [Erythrobacter litoralis]|uniref:Serine proteinase n=1 Tax=Erythrobacter litoralis (strain HTCC2594) TaxID=314225 RepID=Q2N5E0_ERYLH|nr:autotransporter outer membrane beta-barrel domain-containing protein [Erythrobacter litoralis]ABC65101.1 serine proteinase [Erythrobacter litoralis HTCC2594]